MFRELPVFRRFTVDLKRGEFRWECHQCYQSKRIQFKSEEGSSLLAELLAFYEAGGTLYTIVYLNEAMEVLPIAYSQLREIFLDLTVEE